MENNDVEYYSVSILMKSDDDTDIFCVDEDEGIVYGCFSDIMHELKEETITSYHGIFKKRIKRTKTYNYVNSGFPILVEKRGEHYYDIITGIEIYDACGKAYGEIDGIAFNFKLYRRFENIQINLERIKDSYDPEEAVEKYKRKMHQIISMSRQKYKENCEKGLNSPAEYTKRFREKYNKH